MPHHVALNIEGVGDNVVCNFEREDEQAAHSCKNSKSEALRDPLKEFFKQLKEIRDTKWIQPMEIVKQTMRILTAPNSIKRKITTQKMIGMQRLYNKNGDYGDLGDKKP